MKNLRKLREEYGAGEWGTPKLTNKYKSETPGQHPEEQKEEIAEAPKIKVSVNRPIGYRIADIGPGGKEHNVQTKDWPSDHAADARTAHQAAHAALKKGDIETYHKEMDKKFASHKAASAEASKKPVKTYEAFTPDAGRLTQIGKDHTDLKARSTADLHKIHQGTLGKIHSKYTPAEVGGKQGMIADILRYRHGDKHVTHYFGIKEDTTTIEKPVAEESDDKNLRITKHERLAIEAEKRGDRRAQQFHLDKVNKLKKESVKESLDSDEFIDSYGEVTQQKDDAADDIVKNSAFTDTKNKKDLPKEISFGESTEQDEDEEQETGLSSEEKAQIAKIKTLIRLGLIDNSQMQITLRAIKKLDLDQPVTSSTERQAINNLLQQLIGVVTGDDTVFRKIRLNVQK